jgi:hypothetical protein
LAREVNDAGSTSAQKLFGGIKPNREIESRYGEIIRKMTVENSKF